jgi:Dolichyl-phosphate-mannose-protein mannosyltransferase
MHLVARDREPPERHGPHPADALLVAARRLSEIATAISLQTLFGRMISSEKSATFRDHALAPSPDRMRDHARIGYGCAAVALAVACFLAYDAIPDLPLAPQSDEPKKAYFVLAGRQDFLQPLLLLQTVRLANLVTRYTDQLAVVELGRTVAALFGGLTVLATVVLARRVAGRGLALAAGLIAAVTPLVAFHAQLFKEDIVVAPWLLFGLAALDRLRESVELRRALLFGITVGLAASAKYIGAVLLPVACLLPLIAPVTSASLRRYYAALAWAAVAAIAVFALVNAPAFLTPDIFVRGLGTEITHAVTKHIIVWYGWYSHFLFHWTTSLWPGLGPALALAGLAGALLVVADWRASPPAIRLVLVFALLWYLLHELSPMKPFMAIERHMTVMGGLFAVLAVHLADRLSVRGPRTGQAAIATAIVAIIAAPAALSTITIARSAPNDTRSVVERVRAALDGPDAVDWYATFPAHGHYPPLSAIKETTDYVVLVQETADRFAQSRAFAHQSDPVRAYARAYGELLAQPAILVESTAGNFSYRNVPLRVVALGSNAARLEAVLAKLGPLPQTRLTLVPGRDNAAQARAAVDAAQAFRQMVQ